MESGPLIQRQVNFKLLEDKDSSPWAWRNIRFKLFPVEVIFIIYVFVVMFYTQIYKQYFFQHLAKQALSDYNHTINHSICLEQEYVAPITGNATFEKIQATTNNLNMYCEIISLGTGGIIALIYGPLSDIIGRKPIMLSVFSGLLLASIVQLVIVTRQIDLNYYLLSVGLYGLGGAYGTMTGVSFAAASDVTPKKWLTLRMGVVESCIAIGTIFSNVAGFYWFQKSGCDFLPPAILMTSVAAFGFAYILLLFPEPLPKSSDGSTRGFRKLISGGKLFLFPSFVGFSNWWRVWFITFMICLQAVCEIGSGEIMNYFLHNKPLEWSYNVIGTYGIVTEASHALLLLIVLPILLVVGFPGPAIILIAVLFAMGSNALIAISKTTWEMFLVGSLLRVRDFGFPVMRSMLSSLVGPRHYGSVLTIASSFEMTASAGGSILFNQVYHPEAAVNGHKVKAETIFWITVGVWALNIPFVLALLCCKSRRKSTIQLADEKSLMYSRSGNHRSVYY